MWISYFVDDTPDIDIDEYITFKTRQPYHQELQSKDVSERPNEIFTIHQKR